MRRFESPYIADWFAASLRWFVVVGLIISLSLRGQLPSIPISPLILMLAWNMVLSLLAGISLRAKHYHRQAVLSVDFLLAALFFWVQGGLNGPAAWVGLLPILTGAVYFEAWGAILIAVLFALWQYIVSHELFAGGLNTPALNGILLTLFMGLMSGSVG